MKMFKTLALLVGCLTFLTCIPGYASPIDKNFTVVTGRADGKNPKKVSPFYENNYRFYTDTDLDSAAIEVDGTGATTGVRFAEDFSPHIHIALNLWRGEDNYGMRTFEKVSSLQASNLGLWIFPGKTTDPIQTAGALFPDHPGGVAQLKYYLGNFKTYGKYYDILAAEGVIDRNKTSLKQYIEMLIRQVTIHEVGHVFGLRHHDSTNSNNNPTITLTKGRNNDRPSIMIASSTEYFQQLHKYLDRPITINDITLSDSDKRAVRLQWKGISDSNILSTIDFGKDEL
jgi:hypothetical protein